MRAWEAPNKETQQEAKRSRRAGRSQSGAQGRSSKRPHKADGGEMTISPPPANVKLPATKEIQTLAYGLNTLVVAIDVTWRTSRLFTYLEELKKKQLTLDLPFD